MNLFYFLLISLGINILMFFFAFKLKTDKFTDLSYSLTFIILIFISLIMNNYSWIKLILVLMITIWGIRLGVFLFIRIKKIKKDKRFDGMRESFTRFLKFWSLQGLSVWIILIPSLLFMNSNQNKICWLGLIIWAIGLTIETLADIQKYKFTQNPKNKNKFINLGIWKYSRHPNYFGEILCWIGIYIFIFPGLKFPNNLIGLIGPLFISSLLLFFTGIPILEKQADKKWGKTKQYRDYKTKTSILIPWFNKK